MRNQKKGAALVEASMIFPLVIAGVMAVIYIMVGLYSALSLQAALQLSIRKEAGELSQTIYRSDNDKMIRSIRSNEERFGVSKVLTAVEGKKYKTSGLFTKQIKRTEKGRVYVLDEAETVRQLYFARDILTQENRKGIANDGLSKP